MAGTAKSLERDPQLESLLAARKVELGKLVDALRGISFRHRSARRGAIEVAA